MRTQRRLDLRIVAGLAIAMLGACTGNARVEPPPAAPASREPPIVEFAGCSGATKAPQGLRCTLPTAPRVIQLFVSASSVPFVEIDGAPAQALTTPTIAEHGWTIAVTVPPTATTLAVHDADAGDTATPWTMAFDRTAPTPTVDAIETAVPDMNSPGRTPALRKAIDELERVAPELTPSERHRALRLATVLAMDAGQHERAVALGQRALREALAASEVFHVIEIGEILLHATSDDAEREWLLKVLEVSIGLAGDVQHEVRLDYASGYRAHQQGDIGSALEHYERSEAQSRRLGLVTDELLAAAQRTGLLAMIGDNESSERGGERIITLVIGRPREQACTDAQVLFGTAWNLVSRRLLGDEKADAKRVLDRIGNYFEPGGGCDPGDNPMLQHAVRELHLHVAREALTRSDFTECRAALARLEGHRLTEGQQRWAQYVRADLAFRTGDSAEALRKTEGISTAAAGQPLLAWKAALLRSDVLLQQGDRDAALTQALLAEDALELAAGQLAPDQGREGMAAAFHVSAARALEIQIEKGDLSGAARTARRARARRLRPVGSAAAMVNLSPAARARHQKARTEYREAWTELEDSLTQAWRLPTEERARATRHHDVLEVRMRTALKQADAALRETPESVVAFAPPLSGDLMLLYHPLPTGWVGFAITNRNIDIATFSMPADMTGDAATTALLEPFRKEIDEATRIRILAIAELAGTRFHTLPWDGAPLVMAKPVAYALDLGGTAVADQGSQTAVVVADPATRIAGLGRLPRAAAEGNAVSERLQALGWQVVSLSDVQARSHDVIAALGRADWLHYAGHGIAAGRMGWSSALPLAGESSLDVRDILSAPRVPPRVVLSACDTAGAATEGAGMQIASAFLLAGAEFVIAAQGGVSDQTAPRFSAALYDALGDDLRGPELARRAIISLQASGEPMSTWAGFHVWVR